VLSKEVLNKLLLFLEILSKKGLKYEKI